MTDSNISVSRVALPSGTAELVMQVLESGMLASGPMVRRLEAQFAEAVGTEFALAVNNGTTALVLALEALKLGPGDEVVTSSFTFAATLNAIIESGATAVFVDIGDDFCVDVDQLEAAITPATRAVMPVHLYGQPAEMTRIQTLSQRHGLSIVEDAAQAHGARVDGAAAGSFGIGCFSLYGTKNITTGEGGIVTTNDASLADAMSVLRNQGMRGRYDYEIPGHNYRMTDLAAAVGIPQMERLREINEQRRHHAAVLTQGLEGIEGLRLPVEFAGREHVWHQYTVMVTDQACCTRDELHEGLAARGVGSGVYYPRPVFDYDCYRSHPLVRVSDCPQAVTAGRSVLSLPVHPSLSAADLDRIIEATRDVLHA